jgi:hypothetical protein
MFTMSEAAKERTYSEDEIKARRPWGITSHAAPAWESIMSLPGVIGSC